MSTSLWIAARKLVNVPFRDSHQAVFELAAWSFFSDPSILPPGASLSRGQFLTSANGCFKLELQSFGRMVLSQTSTGLVLLVSPLQPYLQKITMLDGGDFVLEDQFWSYSYSHTPNNPGYIKPTLLVLTNFNQIWSTNQLFGAEQYGTVLMGLINWQIPERRN